MRRRGATGFTNANAMLHVANCIANAGKIDRAEPYKFYAEGVTASVERLYRAINAERVLSKADILDQVWRYDFGGRTNAVETYVSYLRRKLGPLGGPSIVTVRGAGYVLRA